MKTKWNFLMVLVLLGTLVGGSAASAQSQGGITGISPEEGTVGTQVTVAGAGFGDKRGEILLGDEKSQVLAWSDTQITFLVDKPQIPNEYAITVLLQGDKKTDEPLTFESFTIRRPRVTSGTLLLDGTLATVVGEFFGDKKGVLRVGYENGGEMIVVDPKILDWSMNTIRFELPDGVIGWFILAVRSEVGTGLALLHLEGGVVGAVQPAPGYQGGEAWENANGIYYKGASQDDNFYVFYNTYNPGYSDNYRMHAAIYRPDSGSLVDISLPKGETEVPIQPLVVGDTMWVFSTGHKWADNVCCSPIWYTTYYDDGTLGKWNPTSWNQIPNVSIYEKNTVAPVYDPRNHRISVYYEIDHVLHWVYTDNFGATWSAHTMVGSGVPIINNFVSAIYWPSATTTALVASTGQVIAVNNGEYRGFIGHLNDDFWRPDLVDLGGETALLYMNHAGDDNTPNITKLNYAMNNGGKWSWSDSTPLVTLPDTGIPLTGYNFRWSPGGAVTPIGADRHLYVLYGAQLKEGYTCYDVKNCTGSTLERWYLLDQQTLRPETALPEITPTVFTQVTAGEQHACAIKHDGTVVCWGNSNDSRLNAPAGTFSQISAGELHTCGVKTDKTIACWGWDSNGQVSKHPTDANYTQVSAGKWHSCALKTDGSVVCWGANDSGRTSPPTGVYFKQISSAAWHNCGIRKDNNYVQCWGDNDGNRATPPANTPFKSISAASWHNCGIKTDNTAVCWGDNDASRVSPIPSGTYLQVATGNWHSCGIKSDGTIACWGSNDDSRVSSRPTTGTFTKIEAGIRNTCAIRSDGAIVCWGNNSNWQSLPPF